MKDSQEHENDIDLCSECNKRPVETPEGFCLECYQESFSGKDRDD